jgi:hypothetical protein
MNKQTIINGTDAEGRDTSGMVTPMGKQRIYTGPMFERQNDRGSRSPLLDLEIIAQGEAEEKNEGDRNDVLHNYQRLNAERGNGRSFATNIAWAV